MLSSYKNFKDTAKAGDSDRTTKGVDGPGDKTQEGGLGGV